MCVQYGIPKELDEESASQFYINPLTVRGMFDVLDIPRGEWLIQSAAGSVLGRQVIQMAKHFGVQTINVVRREEQKQELLEVGCAPAQSSDHVTLCLTTG